MACSVNPDGGLTCCQLQRDEPVLRILDTELRIGVIEGEKDPGDRGDDGDMDEDAAAADDETLVGSVVNKCCRPGLRDGR